MTADGTRRMYASHGTTFKLADGSCDRGPCECDTRAKIPFELTEGNVRIAKKTGTTTIVINSYQ